MPIRDWKSVPDPFVIPCAGRLPVRTPVTWLD